VPAQQGDGSSSAAKPKPKPAPPKPSTAEQIVAAAHALLGIHEIPAHSNMGPDVHRIQSATGAYGAPWCVSTLQYIIRQVLGYVIADDTANVYYLADYGARHGWVQPRPVLAGPVCYRIGVGHAGTVVQVLDAHRFYAVEGNEADAVRLVLRDSRQLSCVFLKPPYLK
jgi:hypothetical protein